MMPMKKPYFWVLLAAVLILQGFSAAAVSAQAYAPVGIAQGYYSQWGYCPQLWSNLSRGMSDYTTGGQVSQLQSFLANRYGDYRVTGGFFGPLTQSYVIRFQREQGLSPVGIVGPYTRVAIANVCGGNPVPVPVPAPVISITNVSGPNTLTVGEQGTWSITTNAPSGSYVSASVRWGDENQYGFASAPAQQAYTSQQNTFSHAYQNAGTYTVTFTVTDQSGRTDSASATVTVSGGYSAQETVSATPTSGWAPLAVAFQVRNANLNSTYYIDYGDGTDAQMNSQCFFGSQGCSASFGSAHTYTHAGTYVARVSASAACPQGMYCAMYLRNVGSVIITVR